MGKWIEWGAFCGAHNGKTAGCLLVATPLFEVLAEDLAYWMRCLSNS